MGLLSGVVNFFTGGSSTADSVIDGVKKAGDMMFYTPEEKAINNKEGFALYIEYQKATMPQNVTRRNISIIVVLLWAFFVLFTALVAAIGFIGSFENFTKLSEYLFKFLVDIVNYPFMMIMGFYFLKRIIPGAK